MGELGWDAFFNTQFELKPGDLLYRARVHHKSGLSVYPPGEMMAPDSYYAKGGRANPMGIPYLYLSDNPETILMLITYLHNSFVNISAFILVPRVYGFIVLYILMVKILSYLIRI